jgi:hypothetical protein
MSNMDSLPERSVHLCKRYEQNGRGVPKLHSGLFLLVLEQPLLYGVEDMLNRRARQDERELGGEPDLRELFDRALYHRREHPELYGMDDLRAWGTYQNERELGGEPDLRELFDRALVEPAERAPLHPVDRLSPGPARPNERITHC